MKRALSKRIAAVLCTVMLLAAASCLFACNPKPPVEPEKNITVRDDGVTVRWDEVDGAQSYNVYSAQSRFSEYTLESSQTGTSFDGENVYGYYRVDAVDGDGEVISSELYSYELQLFGSNVGVYSPLDDMSAVQADIDRFRESTGQFSDVRFAALFKSGDYNALDLRMRYYMTFSGLGKLPTNTEIGGFNVYGELPGGNATCNFWCGIENLTINGSVQWAVSQATSFRRMRVNGGMTLIDKGDTPYASGGYISDTVVDGNINAGGQQQWFTRNSQWNRWGGCDINMVFSGCNGKFEGGFEWPTKRVTVIDSTEQIREKPYLVFDDGYYVCVPSIRNNAVGVSWSDSQAKSDYIPLEYFHVARADIDNADTLNAALSAGKHLLFTPGIYKLDSPLDIELDNTIVLGLGLATLKMTAKNTDTAIRVADEEGVIISGILIDAGVYSNSLMEIGDGKSNKNHSQNPSVFHDLYFRIGGAESGNTSVKTALIINSNDVIGDNFWVWRADHGVANSVGWEINKATNGVVVNGDRVTAYALMVEHFQEYQTVWNGEYGKTVFYQSETPYDPPEQSYWVSEWNGVRYDGYASYKVSDFVQHHELYGAGVYYVASSRMKNVFDLDHGIELPSNGGIRAEHMAIANFLSYGGGIKHIVNEHGDSLLSATGEKKQFTSFIGGVATE